jgi:hypothetical protein
MPFYWSTMDVRILETIYTYMMTTLRILRVRTKNAHFSRQKFMIIVVVKNILPLWKIKVHYFEHINQSFYQTMTKINPVHIPTPQFSHIQFNIILSSVCKNNKRVLPFRFVAQVLYAFSLSSFMLQAQVI